MDMCFMLTAESLHRSNLGPVVVMGASGCGKSSVGQAIASIFGVPFIEGDALHPLKNITKMSSGTSLNDDDRWPWLDIVAAKLGSEGLAHGGAVASCSSLKRIYRDRLEAGAGVDTKFIFLNCTRETLERNQSARKGHFMPAALLDSQLKTLEPPDGEARAIWIDGNQPFEIVVAAIVQALSAEG
jgi:gluconokinase